jgi:Flp pilus assembly protein CpaB
MSYRLKNIVLAGALAALAAVLMTFYVANYRRSVQSNEKNVTVYVAAGQIEEGTSGAALVERQLLAEQKVPRKALVPGAIADPKDVESFVVAGTIYEGEQITKQRFRTVQEQGVAGELRGNMRALQVPGDANQLLAGTLKRGDRVDILLNIRYKPQQVADLGVGGGDGEERVATRVVLRDLLVLNAPPAAPFASARVAGDTRSLAAQLAVTDAQAQKLFFVLKNGDWTFQLRPAVDPADSPDSVETIESVLGDGLRSNRYRQLYAGRNVGR